MERRKDWSWSSALTGAATALTTTAILAIRPRDPKFQIISINLTGFHLNFSNPPLPLLDLELTLTVHVTNPNIVPITWDPAIMSIYYAGDHLGSAQINGDSQAANSCKILNLPAKLDGVEIAQHIAQILADVRRREIAFTAAVDICGTARVLWWTHRFNIHVDSHVTVDPIFLDVIEQENTSKVQLSLG